MTRSKDSLAQGGAVKITDALPATAQTGIIFQKTLTVNYSNGRIVLAGNEQGTHGMSIDDNLYIEITRSDGTTTSYIHFIDVNYSPVDLTSYFLEGENIVNIRIENVDEQGEASAYWLVNVPDVAVNLPFHITEAIPTIPFRSPGTYFGRYFYVDYDGSGRLLLSSMEDGKGLMEVNDSLHVQIVRPDGTSNVYSSLEEVISVVDLTAYFTVGRNLVHLWLENTDTDGGSSAFWLTHLPDNAVALPFEVTPLIPATSGRGDFLGRYFYVNYNRGNSLWLAANGSGTNDLDVNGTLHFQVFGPDGRAHTYTHFAGVFAPVDVSNYFSEGVNLVHLRLEQPSGIAETGSIYLIERPSPPPSLPTTPPGWQIKVTDPIPSGDGELLNTTFEVDYLDGTVVLAAYADGTGQMYIDDFIYIDITHPDGTVTHYQRSAGFSPVDLTSYFKVGTNTVHIRLVDTVNLGRASSFWLINLPPNPLPFPVKINDEIATGDGEFFAKHFYVDYPGNGNILLSRFADGTGNMRIDDFIDVIIQHPNGTEATYRASGSFAPRELTAYFEIGINKVEIRLIDTINTGNASPFWLSYVPANPQSMPIKITDAIATGDGEFFSKYFYVEHTGQSDIILSAFSDGTGQMYIDDAIYITVIHPDRSKATFEKWGFSFTPQNLTPYFNLGINWVQVKLIDTVNTGRSDSFWLSRTGPDTPTPCPTDSVLIGGRCATITPTFTSTPTPTDTPTPTNTPSVTPSVTPVIHEVRPNHGSNTTSNEVNVYGTNFAAGVTVSLETMALTTTFVLSSHLQAIVPARLTARIYDLTVTNPDGGKATLVDGYTVFDNENNDDLFANNYELWIEPAAPHASAGAQLHLFVRRQGGKQPLSNVVVRFYLGDPNAGGAMIGDGTILLLSPRSAANTPGVAWTPPSAGNYDIYAVIDPNNAVAETYETNNILHHTVGVLPPAPDEIPPHVDSFTINEDARSTSERQVRLNVTASDEEPSSGLAKLLFVEYEYSEAANQWSPVQNSDWVDYATSHTNYTWELLPVSGMKYLQVWVADGAGNISIMPYKSYINFAPPIHRVRKNQRKVYRYELVTSQNLTVRLEPVSGDPDLYVWAQDHATRPPWVSNLREGVDDLSINVPVSGMYQIEVFGYSAAEYRLIVDIGGQATTASMTGGIDPTKPTPVSPLVDNRDEPTAQFGLNTPGQSQQAIYLPMIRK
jgi:hypothetical protein